MNSDCTLAYGILAAKFDAGLQSSIAAAETFASLTARGFEFEYAEDLVLGLVKEAKANSKPLQSPL